MTTKNKEIATEMDLDTLASAESTSCTLKHPATGEDSTVVITGWTPDSTEWEKNHKALYGAKMATKMQIEKKGGASMMVDNDPEKRRNLLILAVTDIKGIKGWTYSAEKARELLLTPKFKWMLEQWEDHVEERENFFGKGKNA